MQITVKCFATLARHQPENADAFEVPDGLGVGGLVELLGMDPADVKIMFVNGRHAAPGTKLAPGDRVGLFPAVGGG